MENGEICVCTAAMEPQESKFLIR